MYSNADLKGVFELEASTLKMPVAPVPALACCDTECSQQNKASLCHNRGQVSLVDLGIVVISPGLDGGGGGAGKRCPRGHGVAIKDNSSNQNALLCLASQELCAGG